MTKVWLLAAVLSVAAVPLLAEEEKEQVEEEDIWEQLDKPVSFDFVDTPFIEAIRFLQQLAPVTMVVDPGAIKAKGQMPVTLRVQNMPLQAALKWVARLADLEVSIEDEAVYIHPKNPESEKRVGQMTVKAGGMTLTFEVTEDDLPREMRRGFVHRVMEALERQAERDEDRAQRMRRGMPMDPGQMENLPDAVRERMMKMMEKRRQMEQEGRGNEDMERMRRKMPEPEGEQAPKKEVF